MPWSNARILLLVALVGVYPMVGHATEPSHNASVQVENLLRESIAGADGKEVIVSRVSFPPHTELPWHWHPGEEFFTSSRVL
jgi:quercetin dioxygenase-like cupin family protein